MKRPWAPLGYGYPIPSRPKIGGDDAEGDVAAIAAQVDFVFSLWT
jgi:hypothetical protein